MIRFNLPGLVGNELEYLADAIEVGHLSSSGPYAKRCAELLTTALQAQDTLLTASCTDALEMACLLLDIGPGDTVIVPSFTFTSTALAFARQGANIRFADIEPSTLGIDPACVEALMDDTVRAVVCVHYAGVPCEIDNLLGVLKKWPNAALVEDNAHALFATHKGKPLGSFGRFSTQSFHETKNFQCGEGGALVINLPADVDRAHVLFDKGTNRREFMLGAVDKYSWQDTGSSFGMSDLQGAFLYGQLEQSTSVLSRREAVDAQYRRLLTPHAAELNFQLPVVPPQATSAYHMFYLLLPDNEIRDHVLMAAKESGVHCTFHYVPLHSSAAGRKFSDRSHDCPITDNISGRLIRLPFFTSMTEAQVTKSVDVVVQAVKSFTTN